MKEKVVKVLTVITIALIGIVGIIKSTADVNAGTAYNEYVQYDPKGGMVFSGGDVILVTKAKKANSSSTYKYRRLGWNLTIIRNGVSKQVYVQILNSSGNESLNSNAVTKYSEERVESGSTYYYTSFHIKQSWLESNTGLDLDTGSITIKANARMQAYNAKNGKIYSTNNSWSDWCRNLGWQHNAIRGCFEKYKSDYYDVSVTQVTYKLNVYAGTGVASTSGSGWYAPGTKINYYGTAKAGYNTPTGGSYTMGYGNKDITLTATPKAYTISYNGNGSTSGSMSNSTATYNSNFRTNKNTFTKTGYKFNGWKDNLGKTWGLITAGVYESGNYAKYTYTSNITMYAQWSPYVATLYFNANGGSINSSSYYLKNNFVCNSNGSWTTSSVKYDTTSMDLWNVGTFGLYLTGYNVDDADAWRVGSITGPTIPQSATTNTTYLNYLKNYIKSGNSGIYLYANWKPNTYTVSYDSNGGSGSMSSSTAIYKTSFITSKNTFTRSGYTFKGWNTAEDGSGTWWTKDTAGTYENGNSITWTYTSNITLYAQWTPNTYQITIDPNGGTMLGFNGVETTDEVTRNNNFASTTVFCKSSTTSYSSTAVSTPVRDGFEFVGWKIVSGSGTITQDDSGNYQIEHTYAGNIELQAKWQGEYKITLDPNGGTIYEVTLTKKSGVIFDYSAGPPYYAYATNNKFTVTKTTNNIDEDGTAILDMYISGKYYYYKGSIISMSSAYYNTFLKRGLSYGIPPIPTRDGYTFNGWSVSSGATLFTRERTIETDKYIGYYYLYSIADGVNEVTLTAQWTPNEYKITFDPNGGEVSTTSKTAKTGSTLGTLPTPTHSDSSKQFIGWCYPSVPSEPTDRSNLVYSTTVFNYNKDIALYALWDDKRLDLKYSNNGGALTDEASQQGYIITYDNAVVLGEKITDSTGSTITQPIYDYKYYGKSLQDNDEPYATELRHPEDYFYKTGYHIDDDIAWKIYNDSSYTYFPACEELSSVQNEFLDYLIEQGITAKTLLANWQPNEYNIIYYSNKPSGESNSIYGTMSNGLRFLYNTSYTLDKNEYSLKGYKFTGWIYYDDNRVEQTLADESNFKNLTAKNNTSVVLYAQWQPCEYNVTFDATGGEAEPGAKTVVFNKAYGELPTPTRDGYTFDGWVTIDDESITDDTIVRTASDHTLYAVWSPNSYKVQFDPNGGTVGTTSKTVVFDQQYGTLPTPTRAGYTFTGWAKTTTVESYEDEIITEETIVKTPNDHTLYAIWEPNKYSVYFDDNGGVCSTSYKEVTYTKEYGELPIATREGYTFIGWFTSSTGGTQVLSNTVVTKMEDYTVYAHWSPNTYKVYFDPNGGTCSTKYKEVIYDSTYGELPVATSEEHKFLGWYTSKIGGEQIKVDTIVKITSDITVYARWDSSLDFYIITNSADIEVEPFYIKDDDYLYYGYTNEETNETTYNKMYYTYYYTDEWMWFDSPYSLVQKTGYHIVTDEAYYMEDGTIIPADVDMQSDNEYSDLITKFMTMIKPDKIESTNIYINWQQNKYSVVYDSNKPDTASNNITGTMQKSSYTYDIESSLRKNNFSLTGWTFTGWNTEADGSGDSYTDAQTIKNLTSEKDGVVTLYAQWKSNPYTYNIVYKSTTGVQIGTNTVTYNFDTINEISPKSFSGYTSPESQTIVWDSVTAKTITFIYEPILYTITIDCNGGSGVSSLEYTIESYDFTLGKPKYTGYTFTGWTGTNGKTPNKTITIKKGSIGNRNYTANWIANTYTIVYNSNKPETASSNISQTMKDSVFTYDIQGNLTTNSYSLTGWTFKGWNTKSDGSGKSYSDGQDVLNWTSTDKAVITLYAQWSVHSYTVVYNSNKPSNASGALSGTMSNSVHTYDTDTALNVNKYSLTGWSFVEWNTKADGKGNTVTTGYNLTSTDNRIVNLYAIWRAHTYTINYHLNKTSETGTYGGSTESSKHTYDKAKNLTANGYWMYTTVTFNDNKVTDSDSKGTTDVTLTKQSDIGYRQFIGWIQNKNTGDKTHNDKQSVINLTAVDNGIINMYAKWGSSKITLGSAYREGYTFTGWLDSDGNKYEANTEYEFTEDITMYAQWVQNGYNIIYDKNNTTYNIYGDKVTTKAYGSTSSTSAKFDDNVTLASNGFSKEGYIFKGWSLYKDWKIGDSEEKLFTSGQTIKKGEFLGGTHEGGFTAVNGETITLYAIWEPITYKVAFNSHDNEIGDWNTTDKYYQTVENNGQTTTNIRYDQEFKIAELQFSREASSVDPLILNDENKTELTSGYNFDGWTRNLNSAVITSNTSWSMHSSNTTTTVKLDSATKDGNTVIKNLTAVNNQEIKLYAVWSKQIDLQFDFNNENTDDVILSGKIYNNQYYYIFNLTNARTLAKNNYYTSQEGTVDAYGEVSENGINLVHKKYGIDGTEYRFLGWSETSYENIPNKRLDVFADGSLVETINTRQDKLSIYDSTILYGCWEPVLKVSISVDRTLGDTVPAVQQYSNISNAVCSDGQQSVILYARPGEQCQYIIKSKGDQYREAEIIFDKNITDLYDNQGVWTDQLNPIVDTAELLVENQTHSLNRLIKPLSNVETRRFFIPKYLGTDSSYDSSVGINYYINYITVKQYSYYYSKYYNKDENVKVAMGLYLNTDGSDNISDSILKDLKVRLVMRIQEN